MEARKVREPGLWLSSSSKILSSAENPVVSSNTTCAALSPVALESRLCAYAARAFLSIARNPSTRRGSHNPAAASWRIVCAAASCGRAGL